MSYERDDPAATDVKSTRSAEDGPRFVKLILAALAIAGVFLPGVQRLYLRQWIWAGIYFGVGLLVFAPSIWLKIFSYVPRLLSLAEGLWVWSLDNGDFEARFNREQARLSWKSSTITQVGEDANDREELPDDIY
ncbi:MAG: SHOCT domain-containing protein [Cyanobacteria bacterium P01_D01_bin.123]